MPSPLVLRAFISLMVGHLMIEMALSGSPQFQDMGFDALAGRQT